MQIRKLVKSGYASLVLAIPSEWLKKNKLNAGDSLYVNDDGNKLTLSPEFKQQTLENKEIVISVDGKNADAVFHDIIAAYLDNYHHIIIKGNNLSAMAKKIKKNISELVALELIDESNDKIVARNFLNVYDIDLKSIVRRMDNIVRSMIIDTKNLTGDDALVENITNRDYDINRLSFLVFKILKTAYRNKQILESLGLAELDILKYWEVNIHIEKIGDKVRNIAKIIGKLPKSQRTKFLAIFVSIEAVYKDVMKSLYEQSFELAEQVSQKRHPLIAEINTFLNESNSPLSSQISINALALVGNINDISRVIRYVS